MSSPRRIQSSKANGALARGARTEEGKQRSSLNALRHGMLAQTVVLEGESIERFTALLESLEEEHQPATPTENDYVEIMAMARWMQMRVLGFAKAQFDLEMARQDPSTGQRPIRAANAFRNIVEDGGAYDKCHRYSISYERQYTRAITKLKDFQSTRTRPVPLPDVPGNLANSTWDSDEEKVVFRNEPSPISGHLPKTT